MNEKQHHSKVLLKSVPINGHNLASCPWSHRLENLSFVFPKVSFWEAKGFCPYQCDFDFYGNCNLHSDCNCDRDGVSIVCDLHSDCNCDRDGVSIVCDLHSDCKCDRDGVLIVISIVIAIVIAKVFQL